MHYFQYLYFLIIKFANSVSENALFNQYFYKKKKKQNKFEKFKYLSIDKQ